MQAFHNNLHHLQNSLQNWRNSPITWLSFYHLAYLEPSWQLPVGSPAISWSDQEVSGCFYFVNSASYTSFNLFTMSEWCLACFLSLRLVSAKPRKTPTATTTVIGIVSPPFLKVHPTNHNYLQSTQGTICPTDSMFCVILLYLASFIYCV